MTDVVEKIKGAGAKPMCGSVGTRSCHVYTPMHEVTPKVVAMAVSTVMTMFRILLQRFLFIGDL